MTDFNEPRIFSIPEEILKALNVDPDRRKRIETITARVNKDNALLSAEMKIIEDSYAHVLEQWLLSGNPLDEGATSPLRILKARAMACMMVLLNFHEQTVKTGLLPRDSERRWAMDMGRIAAAMKIIDELEVP